MFEQVRFVSGHEASRVCGDSSEPHPWSHTERRHALERSVVVQIVAEVAGAAVQIVGAYSEACSGLSKARAVLLLSARIECAAKGGAHPIRVARLPGETVTVPAASAVDRALTGIARFPVARGDREANASTSDIASIAFTAIRVGGAAYSAESSRSVSWVCERDAVGVWRRARFPGGTRFRAISSSKPVGLWPANLAIPAIQSGLARCPG